MKNLTATICLTIAVPFGSVWGGEKLGGEYSGECYSV
jgi:hypothetical protein